MSIAVNDAQLVYRDEQRVMFIILMLEHGVDLLTSFYGLFILPCNVPLCQHSLPVCRRCSESVVGVIGEAAQAKDHCRGCHLKTEMKMSR